MHGFDKLVTGFSFWVGKVERHASEAENLLARPERDNSRVCRNHQSNKRSFGNEGSYRSSLWRGPRKHLFRGPSGVALPKGLSISPIPLNTYSN